MNGRAISALNGRSEALRTIDGKDVPAQIGGDSIDPVFRIHSNKSSVSHTREINVQSNCKPEDISSSGLQKRLFAKLKSTYLITYYLHLGFHSVLTILIRQRR